MRPGCLDDGNQSDYYDQQLTSMTQNGRPSDFFVVKNDVKTPKIPSYFRPTWSDVVKTAPKPTRRLSDDIQTEKTGELTVNEVR